MQARVESREERAEPAAAICFQRASTRFNPESDAAGAGAQFTNLLKPVDFCGR